MAVIALKGSPISTIGELPVKGAIAPDFSLTKNDLTDVRITDFAGKVKILNIVPSLDTGVCAAMAPGLSTRPQTVWAVSPSSLSARTFPSHKNASARRKASNPS